MGSEQKVYKWVKEGINKPNIHFKSWLYVFTHHELIYSTYLIREPPCSSRCWRLNHPLCIPPNSGSYHVFVSKLGTLVFLQSKQTQKLFEKFLSSSLCWRVFDMSTHSSASLILPLDIWALSCFITIMGCYRAVRLADGRRKPLFLLRVLLYRLLF